jgi:hypothetical protein
VAKADLQFGCTGARTPRPAILCISRLRRLGPWCRGLQL